MARFRHALGRAAVVLAGTTVLLAVFAVIAGPEAMRAIYGKAFVADRTALALLGVGVGFYLGAATFSQALLALDRGKQAAVAWTLGALAFLALYFAVPGDELMRIAVSFAIGTGLCCVLIATGLAGRMRQ
jgi:O-antigen/teichoic acid export membrane protein